MKLFIALILGMLFGIILVKAEVISWYRIQEMFWFQSFHMYGVIGSAIAVGALSLAIIRKFNIKTVQGHEIIIKPKPFKKVSNLAGGMIFGLGWALTGACPGPLYALVGSGYTIILLAIASAMLGVIVYGTYKDKLPH